MSQFVLTPDILDLCCCTEGWIDALLNAADYVEAEYQKVLRSGAAHWDIPAMQERIRNDLEESTNDVSWLSIDFMERTECWDLALPMLASVSQPYIIEFSTLSSNIYATSAHHAVIDLVGRFIEALYDLTDFEYYEGYIDEEGVCQGCNEDEFIDELGRVYSLVHFSNNIFEIKNHLNAELMRLIVKYGDREDLRVCYTKYPINTMRLRPELNERSCTIGLGSTVVSLKPREFKIYSHIFHHPHSTYQEIKQSLDLVVEDETIKRYITEINNSISAIDNGKHRVRFQNGKPFVPEPSIRERIEANFGKNGRMPRTIYRRGIPDEVTKKRNGD